MQKCPGRKVEESGQIWGPRRKVAETEAKKKRKSAREKEETELTIK